MPRAVVPPVPSTRRSAALVAAGILCSRVAGLVRVRVFAHYVGQQSDAADAFSAAFRIPNLLQNLFGEGALSASFIPVYAALRGRGEEEAATRVAGGVAAILSLTTAVLVLAGVLATPMLISAIAPGFEGQKRELTIALVRILFPGAGLLVLSAWCLGILNSHHRFLLSYTAPVLWNLAMIATLVAYRAAPLPQLTIALAWGSVAGSALQFLVQLPVVLRLVPNLRVTLSAASLHVRTVVRNFLPALVSRGVVQISAYVDTVLASLLPTGAVAALTNAQLLYTLPVSLFGMSVSAAELPAMAGAAGASDHAALRDRIDVALARVAYFIVPSAVAFLALGDVIAAALLQTGRFTRADAVYVWGILAGSAVGLLASTLGRLYASTSYALHDTRTPLRFAMVRVALATMLGAAVTLRAPAALGIDARWGTAGLTLASSVAGWLEYVLLRRSVNRRVGRTGLSTGVLLRLWLSAGVAAAAAWTVRGVAPSGRPVVSGAIILAAYGLTYLTLTTALGVPQARSAMAGIARRIRR